MQIIQAHINQLQCKQLAIERVSLTVESFGKIISEHHEKCHTVNRNFFNATLMLQSGIPGVVTNFGAGYISLKRTSGVVSSVGVNASALNLDGPVNNSAIGIVVGSGTGAEDFEGYALTTQIVHGTTGTQLLHAAHAAPVQNYNAGTLKWTITLKRSFTNTSGASIDIKETGIYGVISSFSIMLWRDLLAAPQAVPNNAVMTVAYDITLTLPA